ncbi:MAG: DNA-binding protein HU [Candidatus Aminicenantes bacterium ADurb.Bin508]|nr:MAG: DNA-binding protein HU [Candidatus Aminicenantes bacterium ADurb.Bin508]HPB55453.1 HU family DNA-binding protein [Candidatus Aminicenantes bacterium]HPT00911.1 HU family DNA-binding protein [Candidatus Aminicenantes bacterium]
MNKAELVAAVAQQAEISKVQAGKVVASFLEGVTHSLKSDVSVTLVGFGTFKVIKRKARKGINPRTKKAINIKASKAPRFVAGKKLKEAVAKK